MRRPAVLLAASALALPMLAHADPTQWAGNGHWYEYVQTSVSATDAFALAAGRTWMGLQGHLVTVTSADENDFVANLSLGELAWMGGSDDGAAVNAWTWRTGPEAGQAFTYTNWASGEPNNCCGGENYVHINWAGLGLWNDHGGPGNATFTNGYVIEFSAPVPEPATALLWLAGLAGVAGIAQRRRARTRTPG